VLISEFSSKLGLDPEQVMQGFKTAARKKKQTRTKRPAVGSTGGARPEGPAKLPRKQAQLLEFLVFYPSYLIRFLEAGIEDILDQKPASEILATLQQLSEKKDVSRPEQIMEALHEGAARNYISRLLVSSSYLGQDDPEVIEQLAKEMLVWLHRYRFKKEVQELSEAIRTAQDENNAKQLEELLLQKARLNKQLAELNIGDA
jgi:hypothetical protein